MPQEVINLIYSGSAAGSVGSSLSDEYCRPQMERALIIWVEKGDCVASRMNDVRNSLSALINLKKTILALRLTGLLDAAVESEKKLLGRLRCSPVRRLDRNFFAQKRRGESRNQGKTSFARGSMLF